MKRQIGKPATPPISRFVQTDRAAHEAWALMSVKSPIAAGVLHKLVGLSQSENNNAVVISQQLLAKMLDVTPRSIVNAVKVLEAGHWIQTVQLGPSGTVNAYVVNSAVAWSADRNGIQHSLFHASVVADASDQSERTLSSPELRKIPVLFKGEKQLPTGPGLPPVSQPSFPGMEPDLPSIDGDKESD